MAPKLNKDVPTTTPPMIDPGKGSLIMNESLDDLNLSKAEYVPVVVATVIFALLLIIGVLSITIFILVLIKGRKKFQEFAFFAIVNHLTVANALHVLMQLTTVLPIMFVDMSDNFFHQLWYKVGSYIIMMTEQASLYFLLLMALNRFAVFVFPRMLQIFTRKGINIISIFIWIYINFIVWWNINYGKVQKITKKNINAEMILLGSNPLTKFFKLCSTFLPIIMLLMYVTILAFIAKKRKLIMSNNRKENERDQRLLYQALIITISLEVVNITTMLSPLITGYPDYIQWMWTIFCYCVTIFNQIVNPLFFLLLNKTVRNIAKHLFDKNLSSFLSDQNTSSVPKTNNGRSTDRCSRNKIQLSCFSTVSTKDVITF